MNRLFRTLAIWVPIAFTACSAPVSPPRVQFDNHPATLSPSKYRPDAGTYRQEVGGSDYFASNGDAQRRGAKHIADERATHAAEHSRREADWRARGSPINCPHCSGGSVYHESSNVFLPGWTTVCVYCHGTGKISAVR